MPRPYQHGQRNVGVRIWWDASVAAYRLQSPYNAGFVEAIKSAMAKQQYAWDPDNKIWTFTEPYLDAIVKLCELAYGGKPAIITRQQVEAAQQPQQPTALTAAKASPLMAEFFELVPYDAMRRAYLHACNILHPDKGGDMDKMSKLNAAWQRLEKEFYLKGGQSNG